MTTNLPHAISSLKTRKSVILIFLLIIIFIFTTAGYLIYKSSYSSVSSQTQVQMKTATEGSPELDAFWTEANNEKLSKKDRYSSLLKIVFYLGGEYSQTHDSVLRDYVNNDLNEFAKKNFPEQYQVNDFLIPCSDTDCGREITTEFQNIMNIIKESDLDEIDKRIINMNLTTVAYKPVNDKDNAVVGLSIAISQLEETGNNTASNAANLLKEYLKKTYNVDYEN